MNAIRLQRYLAQAGIAARRKAETLITSGAVTVNGEVVTTLGAKVIPGKDRVKVDGQPVYPQDQFYVLFNKPKGCITAVSDPEGRLTVMDYLHNLPVRVAPVGRLDFYSEGVLLLTNDGELSARLQSPEMHVEKTYHVKVRGRLSDAELKALREGVRLDDGTVTRPAQVDTLSAKSRHQWLVITLTEGKSRQIHRMLEALGHTVLKLQRVAFGGLTFHGLRVGDARELNQTEINALREQVGLSKDVVARGSWSCTREQTELGRRARLRQAMEAGKSFEMMPEDMPDDAMADMDEDQAEGRGFGASERPGRGGPGGRPERRGGRPERGPSRGPARGFGGPGGRSGARSDRGSDPRAGGPRRPGAGGPQRPGGRMGERPGPRVGGRPSGRPGDAGSRFGERTGDRTGPRFGGRPGGRPGDAGPRFGGRPGDAGPRTGERTGGERTGPRFGSRPGGDTGPRFGGRPGGRPGDAGPRFGGRPGDAGPRTSNQSSDRMGESDRGGRPSTRSLSRPASPRDRAPARDGGYRQGPDRGDRGGWSGGGRPGGGSSPGRPASGPGGPERRPERRDERRDERRAGAGKRPRDKR